MRSPKRTRDSTPAESQQLVRENYRLVLAWSVRMFRRSYFDGWTADDIASAAYISAVDLVDEKFDPKLGKLGTFLYTRLYSRVRYQWASDRGFRWDRLNRRWIRKAVELDEFDGLVFHLDPEYRESDSMFFTPAQEPRNT
jgi:DNA-directed RNA polymerase specialized sigma24 family protein